MTPIRLICLMLAHMLWAGGTLAQESSFVSYSQKFGSMLDSLWSTTTPSPTAFNLGPNASYSSAYRPAIYTTRRAGPPAHAPYRASVNKGGNRFLLPYQAGRTFMAPGVPAAPGFTFGIVDVINNAVAVRDWSRMELQYSHARQQTQDTLPKGSMLQAQAVFYKNTFMGFYPMGSTHMVENFDSLYIKQPITLYGTNYGLALELGYSCSGDGLICTPRMAHPSEQDARTELQNQMPLHMSEMNFVRNSYRRDHSFLHNREFDFSRYDRDRNDRPRWDSDVDLGIFNASFDEWQASDRETP